MAENPNSVVINIGSQRVSMAIFEVAKTGGLVLKAYDSQSIAADPAMESARLGQIRVAISDLAKRVKPGKTKARYALAGQSVFTRFVKLPPLQEDNIDQLVTFEAQQHVPFPLNEVIWDYELIDGATDKEAVIVAIKSDALDEINAAVNDAGLATAEVDVAPMALYNAFRATYGEPEEPVLLIDIGAKTSNLLYIEGKRFFTRSVGIGGASVTAAIAKEYGVPFAEAESQKISNGLVVLGGGHTEQLDESVAALGMVIRQALSRLPSEIARTTNYFRSQHGGKAPRKVLLAGGGAILPYTLEFFQETLNLPIEYFNPVRNVAIGKNVDSAIIQREGHLMGELVGLALRAAGKSSINIDLVPAEVEKARASDRRKPFLIGAAALLLGGMALWAVFQNLAASQAETKKQAMLDTKAALEPVVHQIGSLLKTETALRQIADGYTNAELGHNAWLDVIGEIRGAFASDVVWLTEFEPLAGFDIQKAIEADPTKTTANGTPIVKPEFYSTTYGDTSLAPKPTVVETVPKRGKKAVIDAPVKRMANAIRIRGYWRENTKGQNIVSDLLANLREKSQFFQLSYSDPKTPQSPPRELNTEILKVTINGPAGELAWPFEITLPLAREIPVE